MIENVRGLEDAVGLSRCGIESDFTSAELLGKTIDSPEVKYQDALAARMHRVNDLILSHRSGSLVERCHYYPFRLVTLVAENDGVAKAGLAEFEKDVKAWWAAKDMRGLGAHNFHTSAPLCFWCGYTFMFFISSSVLGGVNDSTAYIKNF